MEGELYELGEQVDPLGVHGDIVRERALYQERSERADAWLLAQPERVAAHMRQLQVRCPDRGCLLAEVYRFPLTGTGERFLARTHTIRRNHVGFLNWAYSDDGAGQRVWFPSGCRHGEAKLELGWLDDLVGLIRGWHHALQTVEQMRANYPEAERRGLARRTFHPKIEVWRPKSR